LFMGISGLKLVRRLLELLYCAAASLMPEICAR
jgi:hypothetical protein